MGLKSIPIEAFPPSYWRVLEGKLDDTGPLSVTTAYRNVPVLHRAVDIRSKAISSLPYILMKGEEDITNSPQIIDFMRIMRPLLGTIEMHLCLFGAAYLYIERNRYGLNAKLRPMLPTSIKPIFDEQQGLIAFNRTIGNKVIRLEPKDVIYVWMPNVEYEVGPGHSPAQVAIRSAATLYFLDTFLENFWRRGAIKATLLSVNGPSQQAEMEKLENWWKRFMSGVKNAYNTVAIRADIKPIIIGDTLKDTVNPELTEQARTDTLTALGVPHSLVLSNAANYATAKVDTLAFYENTIVPEAHMICDALNEQLLVRSGIRLVPRPDKLETYQRDELEKAQGLLTLVGTPILTVNEARDMMGYGPIDQAPMNIDDKFNTPEEVINAVAPATDNSTLPVSTDTTTVPQKLKSLPNPDLQKWKSKAIKSMRSGKSADVSFNSDVIPSADAFHLKQLLSTVADIDSLSHVFNAFKIDAGGGLTQDEQELYDILVKAMNKIRRDAINAGIELNVNQFSQRLAQEVSLALNLSFTNIYQSLIKETISKMGIGVDPVDIVLAISPEWNSYLLKRKAQLEDTTRRYLISIINGIDADNLSAALDIPFGNRRAEIIAVTELTNMYAVFAITMQKILFSMGIQTKLVWITAEDELVCPKCNSYNGLAQGNGWNDPPPIHPYCRCRLELIKS